MPERPSILSPIFFLERNLSLTNPNSTASLGSGAERIPNQSLEKREQKDSILHFPLHMHLFSKPWILIPDKPNFSLSESSLLCMKTTLGPKRMKQHRPSQMNMHLNYFWNSIAVPITIAGECAWLGMWTTIRSAVLDANVAHPSKKESQNAGKSHTSDPTIAATAQNQQMTRNREESDKIFVNFSWVPSGSLLIYECVCCSGKTCDWVVCRTKRIACGLGVKIAKRTAKHWRGNNASDQTRGKLGVTRVTLAFSAHLANNAPSTLQWIQGKTPSKLMDLCLQ